VTTSFRKLVKEAERKIRALRRCKLIPISQKQQFPKAAGVYVICKGKRNLYAGLARNVQRRLIQHSNGRQIQSAFTLKLTAHTYRKNGKLSKSLNRLRTDREFRKIYARTADRIKRMKARYVLVDSMPLRIVLEVYAGMTFKTKWNDFNVERPQ
jgi:predicted GIY-YIG superfamily endonuclease